MPRDHEVGGMEGEMVNIRTLTAGLVLSIGCLFLASDTDAQWSVGLSNANNEFLYGHYGQLGHHGFFGEYDIDA
ncbi:MAG: hypothetical protein RDU20_13950, partial [Desulfomonilaceae bacterium]|nr:hypothetical protein [Desulfomonilaceae bacterium]